MEYLCGEEGLAAGLLSAASCKPDLRSSLLRIRSPGVLHPGRVDTRVLLHEVRALAVEKAANRKALAREKARDAALEAEERCSSADGSSDDDDATDDEETSCASRKGDAGRLAAVSAAADASRSPGLTTLDFATRYRQVLVLSFAVSHAATTGQRWFLLDDGASSGGAAGGGASLMDALANLLEETWVLDRSELVAALVACLLRYIHAVDAAAASAKLNRVWVRIFTAVDLHSEKSAAVAIEFCRGCEVFTAFVNTAERWPA